MALPFPILTAEEAAALIDHGSMIGFSGFTAAGAAKAIPEALARRAEAEHAASRPFQIGVLTGASTGPSFDGALARAEAISFRAPYQSDPLLRRQINEGKVRFTDLHLSMLPQMVRYGFLGPLHWAVVEAADVTPGGGVVLTSSVGVSPTYLRMADRVLLELNARHPAALIGMHDIFEPQDPPTRHDIPVFRVHDRVGSPICTVDPRKIAGVVLTDRDDESTGFGEPSVATRAIGQHICDFLVHEIRVGRIPSGFLPLQSGVGDVANSVLAALGASRDIPKFEMYTEVLQDSVIPLIDNDLVRFASTCSLTLSPAMMRRLYDDLPRYRRRILMRPQEISNHPEIVRRLGIISMNTAIEFDLIGNVNSTHVMGVTMMNGIGGSGDFTRNAYLSIFSCASTHKDGRISTVVPLVSHMDHSEHSVQVVVTEQGVADLRGLDPHERARHIIERCAHPDYRDLLREYHALANHGHEPFSPRHAFAMHEALLRDGDMRRASFTEVARA